MTEMTSVAAAIRTERAPEAERRVWGIKTFTLTLVFVAVLAALGVYQVRQRYQVYSLGVSLSQATLEYRVALDQNKKLRLELATLKRAGRIRREAAERLEMHVPAPQDIVEIR